MGGAYFRRGRISGTLRYIYILPHLQYFHIRTGSLVWKCPTLGTTLTLSTVQAYCQITKQFVAFEGPQGECYIYKVTNLP